MAASRINGITVEIGSDTTTVMSVRTCTESFLNLEETAEMPDQNLEEMTKIGVLNLEEMTKIAVLNLEEMTMSKHRTSPTEPERHSTHAQRLCLRAAKLLDRAAVQC